MIKNLFTLMELEISLKQVKNGKAAGLDDICEKKI